MVGLRFSDTTGDNSHSNLRHEFNWDTGTGVGALQVVNELLGILDGVDIVMIRRRNEPDAKSRVPGPSDRLRNLMARKFASFSRLCTLGHLDLELIGIDEVVGRHTEGPEATCLMADHMVSQLGNLHLLPQYSTSLRGGSWRLRESYMLPWKWSRRTWLRCRSGGLFRSKARLGRQE